MMKKLSIPLIFICLIIFGSSFTDDYTYVIKGTTDQKEGIAILNNYVNPDTVIVKDGKFEFHGIIEKPTLISFQIPPFRYTRIILEPGDITIAYSKKDGYRLGGSPNNIRFQKIEDQIKPYADKLAALWQKYNQTEGDEKVKIWHEYDQAKTDKINKTGELVKQDKSFAGFIEVFPIQYYETAGNLKFYLEHFKAYSNESSYKRLEGYYQGVANTDIGVAPPTFTLPDPEGTMISLSSFKGKYVLIDFWYSGCGWCRKMTPHLIKIYAVLKEKGFEIVSISVDPPKDEAKWRKAMEEDKATWLQLWDYEKSLPIQYSVTGYPTMFFLDKEGKVLQRIYGYHDEPILREFFNKYVH